MEPSVQNAPAHLEEARHDFGEEVVSKLEAAFSLLSPGTRSHHELAKIVEEYNPLDLAVASLKFAFHQRRTLFEEIGKLQERVEFIIHIDSATRSYIFRDLEDEAIVEIINLMPPDEAVWIMEDLVVPRYRRIIERLDPKKAEAINQLAKYKPDSAGRWMTGEFFAFSSDTTIGQAAAYIRDHPSIDLLRRIFVHDEEGVLQGFVPLRNLVINPPSLPLKRVMRSITHLVDPQASRDGVIAVFEHCKGADLPVVDRVGRLLGVITYEDITEAIEEQTDETLSAIAGTTQSLTVDDPLWKSMRSRAPWLVVTLAAGFVNMKYISRFDTSPQLMLFVPLVIGMSGNIGIQSSTLMIRAMSLGLISGHRTRELLAKEVITSMLIGLIFGLATGVLLLILSYMGAVDLNPWHLACIVSLGQIGACLLASVVGVFSPLLFSRCGLDPAVASGPLTTAVSDVLSSIIYFLVATWIGSWLKGL